MVALLGIEMPLHVSGITMLRQTQFVFNANDYSCLSVLNGKDKDVTKLVCEFKRCHMCSYYVKSGGDST